MLTDLNGKFVVVAITRDETRIWLSDASRGTAPEDITRPKHDEAHRHVREAQAKNRELGIVNWYSLNSVIVNDAAQQKAEKAKDKTQ